MLGRFSFQCMSRIMFSHALTTNKVLTATRPHSPMRTCTAKSTSHPLPADQVAVLFGVQPPPRGVESAGANAELEKDHYPDQIAPATTLVRLHEKYLTCGLWGSRTALVSATSSRESKSRDVGLRVAFADGEGFDGRMEKAGAGVRARQHRRCQRMHHCISRLSSLAKSGRLLL